ncbi:hypothetical protein NC653_035235 [Populus alba x Populus x berolinensis]|uniref:Uncharacterized protein n=1 Tax=Populus alba x Populus x berolinensis TaxID=444605 RepID=A0AAD6LPF0_9ROSI|nr:hypothetical protein NC653_035235 [Populus alba x Populus x berolinensis]
MLVLFPLKAETIRQMEGEQHETMQLNVIKKLASLAIQSINLSPLLPNASRKIAYKSESLPNKDFEVHPLNLHKSLMSFQFFSHASVSDAGIKNEKEQLQRN